uniref:Uncharacterized protein n=1 Tax=Brassica oleracea var. oleracea TaxID=109376 RepID=A0A0D2ZXF2_BRAOL
GEERSSASRVEQLGSSQGAKPASPTGEANSVPPASLKKLAAEAGSDNTAFLQHILDDLSENGVQSSAFKEAMNQIGLVAQSPLDQFEIVPLIPMNIGGNLVPNAWQSLVELLYDFVLNL